jgi:ectoine hydroxylase-related dioxygenase (phytanoyl-CoA dioxygenase family)
VREYSRDPRALNVPLVESPFFDDLVSAMELDPADRAALEQFRREGYLILEEAVIDLATVDRALEEMEGRYDEAATGYDAPSRKQDAWRFSTAVGEIARAPRVLDLLRLMYGRRPIPFQTLNFQVGTRQRAHSDTVHFHSIPQRFMAGAWVALEDIHPDSGPLVVYPGSHHLPVFDPFDLGIEASWSSYREYEDAIEALVEAMGLSSHPVVLRKGQAVLWAANLIHGGSRVADPERTRLSQVTHYYFEDCVYYQPAASEPFVGRLALKDVREVGTDRSIPNLYRGRPVEEWLGSGGGPGLLGRLLGRR